MMHFSPYQYIQIDIANHAGLDKEVWQDRLDWVNRNEATLENIDEGILYRKAVRAYREIQKGNPTGHMVSLDSTWSGGQLMAVLMRCSETAKASNLIDTDKRNDIYTLVMDHMNNMFNMNVSRQDIKDVLMPRYYQSTASAINLFGKGTPELQAFLSTCADRLPGAEGCLNLMKQTWNPNVKHHTWEAPDKHISHIPVMVKCKSRIKIDNTSFTHIANINMPSEKGLANSANFIQSLDSYIVREMIRKAKTQGYQLVTIHDAFFCSPLHMQKTRENYLDILIDMASKPILTDWINHMLGTSYPEQSDVEINSFISKLKTAEYFLS